MRNSFARLLAAALLLAVLLAGASTGAARSSFPAVAAPAVELYVTYAPDGHWLAPLDPETLADCDEAPMIFPSGEDWDLSGDGSTLVSLRHDGEPTIVVQDPVTGAKGGRLDAPGGACCVEVSHDGSRVVLVRADRTRSLSGTQPRVWYVLDTADGGQIAPVETDGAGTEHILLSPDARRLYQFVGRAWVEPKPMRLVAYDLTTGVEIGQIELSEVLAGSHIPGRTVDGARIYGHLRPGMAISPNGQWIAIAHADREAITLIDTATLEIVRTVALTRPPNVVDHLLGWLPLAPQTAEAKVSEGVAMEAVFSADGRHLYVYGTEEQVEGAKEIWASGLGLKVVDVETGEIVAEALEGELIQHVFPTPDGRSVYAVGPVGGRWLRAWVTEPEDYTRSYVVRRLDATSLDVLAEREFSAYPWLLVGAKAR